MKLDEYIGLETLDREYKELYLLPLLSSEINLNIKELLHEKIKNKESINKLILTSIKTYIKNFLPKYISVFNNSNINGNLYFGINDFGFIEGIPYYGEFPKNKIISYIKSMNKFIKIYDYNNKSYDARNYINNLDIDIIDLKYDSLQYYKEKFDENLNNVIFENEKLKNEWKIYTDKHIKWVNDIYYYGTSITNYMTDNFLRNCIADYIEKKKFRFKKYMNELNDLIIYFKSDKVMNSNFTYEEIQDHKQNVLNPVRWILEFKDYMTFHFKSIKPYPPLKKPNKLLLNKFCYNLSNLKYPLLNNGFNYYLIIIKIKSINNNTYTEYRKPNNKMWYYKRRELDKYNQPCTN